MPTQRQPSLISGEHSPAAIESGCILGQIWEFIGLSGFLSLRVGFGLWLRRVVPVEALSVLSASWPVPGHICGPISYCGLWRWSVFMPTWNRHAFSDVDCPGRSRHSRTFGDQKSTFDAPGPDRRVKRPSVSSLFCGDWGFSLQRQPRCFVQQSLSCPKVECRDLGICEFLGFGEGVSSSCIFG